MRPSTLAPLALALFALPLSGPGAAALRFTNVAARSGIKHSVTFGPETHKKWIIETTGVGVAVADFDQDGIEDLYFANGSTVELYRKGATPPGWLYRGQGAMSYLDVTPGSGAARPMWGSGAFAADYDNDGNPDLYLTAWGKNTLLRNRGDGSFEDVTAAAGVAVGAWSFGAGFADVDGDGLTDLFVANYAVFDLDDPPHGGKPCVWREQQVMCGPLGLPGQTDVFFRNRGDGTFEDATRTSGLVDAKERFGMGVVWFDADRDGKLDLYVANDSVPNLFFRQIAPGRFEDQSVVSGLAFNSIGKSQASMGVAVGDADGDGLEEVFTTNFAMDTNTYYKNNGDGFFLDMTDASLLGPPSYYMLAWSTSFDDFDNDGDLDLWVANGHVYPEVERAKGLGTWRQPTQLFENDGKGRFADRTAEGGPGLNEKVVGRGGAVLDADGDGRLDILLTQLSGPALLLHNDSTSTGHWLEVELEGTHCARDAIGARLVLETPGKKQTRGKNYAQGYLSSPSPRLHFGLGTAERATLAVRWPCGKEDRFPDLPADTIIRVREGQGRLARPAPGRKR